MESTTEAQNSTQTPTKPMKTTISRTFTIREPKRYVTIHYHYDRLSKVLKYGASIHLMDGNEKEKFNKKGHQGTAQKRFNNRPITITNFISDKDTGIFHRAIRQQLYSYGTKSPKEELKTYELVKVPSFKTKKVQSKQLPPKRNRKEKGGDLALKKEMKPVISRLMSVKEFKGNTKRIVTIQYKYDRVNEKLEYGATIYKSPLNTSEKYDKDGHKKTALARFQKHPIIVEGFKDKDGQQMFNKNLRNLLHKYGVQQKTQ